ncbi:transcription termination factor Rho [Butyrivibrio sp. YAB3001]|uniref:transcription termination factor Rho n=1 Tax=Butyrivibrio sp. YAB3001 TaxID=1520812 RepID=UPI0008F6441A|nr:transcription termination factor Rho [Butyrivibrio sp. YAB3001]SFB72580.1 transcription termination factor Rho [Butyrivibrio sp. YAB3001]
MRERYETLKLNDLRDIAKKRGIKGATAMKKAEIIDIMCELDEKDASEKANEQKEEKKEEKPAVEKSKKAEAKVENDKEEKAADSKEDEEKQRPIKKHKNIVVKSNKPILADKPVRNAKPEVSEKSEKVENTRKAEKTSEQPKDENEEIVADGDDAHGILEVMQDGYGFIRCENYLPGENDVYVAPSLIRKFNLKTGDILKGKCRAKKETDKFAALVILETVNGYRPEVAMGRWNFENMTPIFPNSRIKLEQPGCPIAMRIMDLISPIGKGQRGMIVSPPKAGKTTLLKEVAKSILKGNRDIHLIILLIDERPEEVTDIKESIEGPNAEVIYSTFDELPEHHKRVAEMVMERAKRLVEHGKDVVILLDSITRLTRAYNIVVPPSGRTLSGGLDPAALHMPKKFFGAARNMREGGSLTVLATALIETGSKMDDVIYEEFKGTGNMEMVLDRKLQEKRIFPAINIPKSSTRREDLLLSSEELAAINSLRKGFNGMKADDAVDQCITLFSKTRSNTEFVRMVEKQIHF